MNRFAGFLLSIPIVLLGARTACAEDVSSNIPRRDGAGAEDGASGSLGLPGLFVDGAGRIRWRRSNALCVLNEMNSPEDRLVACDTAALDAWQARGYNAVSVFTFGGDVEASHPWVGNGSWKTVDRSKYDTGKLATWKAYAKHGFRSGVTFVVFLTEYETCLLLGEGPTLSPECVTFDEKVAGGVFGDALREENNGGLILVLSEETRLSTEQTAARAAHLKALVPEALIGLHTLPGEYWRYEPFVGTGELNLLVFQASLADIGALEADWHARPFAVAGGVPWATYGSELIGGVPDAEMAAQWAWASPGSGWGNYQGYAHQACSDLSCPEPESIAPVSAMLAKSRELQERGNGIAVARMLGLPVAAPDANGDGVLDAADVVVARRAFNHVMVIWGENASFEAAMAEPTLAALAASGATFTNYHGITHPSQPNYLAATSGAPQVDSNVGCVSLSVRNLAELLDAAGISWRDYLEYRSGPCTADVRHSFFEGYTSTKGSGNFRGFDSSDRATYAELLGDDPPAAAFVTPDDTHNGHNTGVATFGAWIAGADGSAFVRDVLASKYFSDGVVVLAFDEDDDAHGNHVYCVIVGAGVKAGYVDVVERNHYDLLRTIETNFGLPTLTGNDAAAGDMLGAFNARPDTNH